jgi:hypothetical protein
MQSTLTSFDFTEFARNIYREKLEAHRLPFLLPALYGGELSQNYEALFVLEAPSVSFTEKHWRPCHTTEMAIQTHRAIFLKWAYRSKRAHLFKSLEQTDSESTLLSPIGLSNTEFFRRFYVTDIWKDAAFMKRKDREYKEYWLSKLATELEMVSARRVIFIGKEAERGRCFVPSGIPTHSVPFPSRWITEEDFKRHVARLAEEIRAPIS